MKLTYWVAKKLNDSDAYSIRTKTKKEAEEQKASSYDPDSFGIVKKVTVEYRDAFDLLQQCSSEGRMCWEGV